MQDVRTVTNASGRLTACGTAITLAMRVGCRSSNQEEASQQQLSARPVAQLRVRTAPAGETEPPHASVHPVSNAPASVPGGKTSRQASVIDVPAGSLEIDGKTISVSGFAIDRTEVTVDLRP
jgi:hypothetical protein